ncbi:hypothetical protein TRIATDRAFT_300098 [Trichoderma atroviride IMI 206040]|uniref:Uncharacterized protein n=1 Tax=Hypocrea atroviridis (strain ATCC 20476 / IMI 206040) TaxID=452589 RepID=G9NX52_HYPAI|nr:uncharacterized protein TRIATDRAFT_300098 [Trichoderma atroviride IMI 206040]EHK45484.1 hypothetical protein TRIATDRAFT_300098 [Trichoderma atroviride IMI 206040]
MCTCEKKKRNRQQKGHPWPSHRPATLHHPSLLPVSDKAGSSYLTCHRKLSWGK